MNAKTASWLIIVVMISCATPSLALASGDPAITSGSVGVSATVFKKNSFANSGLSGTVNLTDVSLSGFNINDFALAATSSLDLNFSANWWTLNTSMASLGVDFGSVSPIAVSASGGSFSAVNIPVTLAGTFSWSGTGTICAFAVDCPGSEDAADLGIVFADIAGTITVGPNGAEVSATLTLDLDSVENGVSGILSLPFAVSTVPLPSVSIAPAGPHDLCGGPATLTATASSGTPPYTYEWVRDYDTPPEPQLIGIPNYDPTQAFVFDPGTFYVIVTDSNGCTAQSNSVVVSGSGACAPPGGGMVGWWHFDESSGPLAAEIAHYTETPHPGTHGGSPQVVVGAVENSLEFDGTNHVSVPHNKIFNLHSRESGQIFVGAPEFSGDFSISAWVKVDALGTVNTIVSKGGDCSVAQAGAPLQPYYSFYVDGTGLLGFTYNTGTPHQESSILSAATGSELSLGEWTHVAVTVQRAVGLGAAATFYVNGSFAGPSIVASDQGPVNSTRPLLIGALCTSGLINSGFTGSIDEVQIFQRALDFYEVLESYNAGACGYGSCKLFIASGRDIQFCPGQTTGTFKVYLCNYTSSTKNLSLIASGLIPGFYSDAGPVSVAGPSVISVSPSSLTLQPDDCKVLTLMMDKPEGLNQIWERSGYALTSAFPTQPSDFVSLRRGIRLRENVWCPVSIACTTCAELEPGEPGIEIGVGETEDILVVLDNTNVVTASGDYKVQALDVYGQPSTVLSLDGQAPGVGITGSFSAPPSGSVQLQFSASFTQSVPFDRHEIQVLVDHDSDGMCELTSSLPVISVGTFSIEEPSSPFVCDNPIDKEAKIMLHIKSRAAKGFCTTSAPTMVPSSQMVTEGNTVTPYDVYMIAAGGLEGIRGAAVGVTYPDAPGIGVNVFGWEHCFDLEFPGVGWPNSGGTNVITSVACHTDTIPGFGEEGMHAILGSFYVYAYGTGVMQLTPSVNHDGHLADCQGAEHCILPEHFGSAGFGTVGYNPSTDTQEETIQGLSISTALLGATSVYLTFDQVTVSGASRLVDLSTPPEPLGTHQLATTSGLFHQVATSATWTGNVSVSVAYEESELLVSEDNLILIRLNEASWEDATSIVDTTNNIVCSNGNILTTYAIAQGPSSNPEIGDSAGSTVRIPLTASTSFPNPFNSTTRVMLEGTTGERVSVRIFDIRGRLIRTIWDAGMNKESQGVAWNGTTQTGRTVPSGVYFMAIEGEQEKHVRKLVLSR